MISLQPEGDNKIQSLIDEVLTLVENYSDFTDPWIIESAVHAWDILYSYTQDVQLLGWLKSLSADQHDQVYEDFLRRWRSLYPFPVYKAW